MRLENQGTRKTEDSYPSNTFNEYCLYVLTTNSSKYAALRSILKSVLIISDDELGNREWEKLRQIPGVILSILSKKNYKGNFELRTCYNTSCLKPFYSTLTTL